MYETAVKSGKLSMRKYWMVVEIIYLAVTLGILCCLYWATTAARYGRGVAVKAFA